MKGGEDMVRCINAEGVKILYSLCYNGKQIDLTPHEVKIEFDSSNFEVVIAGLFGII